MKRPITFDKNLRVGIFVSLLAIALSNGHSPSAFASDHQTNLSTINSIADAEALLLNATILSYLDDEHGTQIEYLREDGSTSLWYPGNRNIVRGAMELRESDKGLLICFVYFGGTYNPITRQRGGSWQCTKFTDYAMPIIDIKSGDLFGLSARRQQVPHKLERNAAQLYAPPSYPALIPYLVNGKTPLENLQSIWTN